MDFIWLGWELVGQFHTSSLRIFTVIAQPVAEYHQGFWNPCCQQHNLQSKGNRERENEDFFLLVWRRWLILFNSTKMGSKAVSRIILLQKNKLSRVRIRK